MRAEALGTHPDSALLHYNLGVVLAVQDQYDEAIEAYRAAASVDPLDPDTLNNLGFLLAARGDTREAAELFSRVIQRQPDHAGARFNRTPAPAPGLRTGPAVCTIRTDGLRLTHVR